MIHDAVRSGEDDVAELTRREEPTDPVLDFDGGDIKAWADHTALVEASSEFNNDLAGTVVIDDLKLSNVACPFFPPQAR